MQYLRICDGDGEDSLLQFADAVEMTTPNPKAGSITITKGRRDTTATAVSPIASQDGDGDKSTAEA